MRPFVLAVSAVTMAALAAGAPAGQVPADDLFERARAINRASPLIDGHNDYPWAVREKAGARPRQRSTSASRSRRS